MYARVVRIAPIIRPILTMVNNRQLRDTSLSLFGIIYAVRYVLCLITFMVIWFAMVLFVVMDQFCPVRRLRSPAFLSR